MHKWKLFITALAHFKLNDRQTCWRIRDDLSSIPTEAIDIYDEHKNTTIYHKARTRFPILYYLRLFNLALDLEERTRQITNYTRATKRP